MFNPQGKIEYGWNRLKACVSRLFGLLKIVFATCFLGLMFVIANYVELRALVLSVLDEQTVHLIKEMVEIVYGSSSVLFALEQTFILLAMPAIGLLLRAVCTYSFVSLVILLIFAVCKTLSCDTKVILRAQPQSKHFAQNSSKWLTLCRIIC